MSFSFPLIRKSYTVVIFLQEKVKYLFRMHMGKNFNVTESDPARLVNRPSALNDH